MNKQDFTAALKAQELDHHLPRFEAEIKDTIRYTMTQFHKYTPAEVGQSRIGGLPDLPKDVEWPTDDVGNPLAFIAQLDLQAVKPYDIHGMLPATGWIYFFYEADQMMSGLKAEEKEMFKVMYADCPKEDIAKVVYPAELPEFSKYYPCSLTYANEISLPQHFTFLNSAEREVYDNYIAEKDMTHKSFGHADHLQENMEDLCRSVLGGNDEWILLLQVDSNDDAYMDWANGGKLYFWIKKEDLLRKNFDDCWCFLQYIY